MVKARKFILARPFDGEPTLDNFEIVEEELPPLKDGEVLVEAEWLSVDPYMRVRMPNLPPRSEMVGGQVARVVESRNAAYPVGAYVNGRLGWRTHTVFDPKNLDMQQKPLVLPELKNLRRSVFLGVLGMPGNTAYFGLLEICKPKAGETLVVSVAAGAVGSIVGQIGKIKGLTVIGIAGTPEKCRWIKETLGFDFAINYKTQNVAEELQKAAPNGVDCYFDNVGGEISSIVINQMNDYGRISVCGSISGYNATPNNIPTAPILQPAMVFKQLKMEGFLVWQWYDRHPEGIKQLAEWIEAGKIKYEETLTEGFENMPSAFIEMLKGANTGKAVIRA